MGEGEWERESGRGRVGGGEWEGESGRGYEDSSALNQTKQMKINKSLRIYVLKVVCDPPRVYKDRYVWGLGQRSEGNRHGIKDMD